RLCGAHVLDGDLDVVEAERPEALEPLAAEGNAAGDEVRVEIELARAGDERFQIVPHERLATGQVELDDAQGLGLAKHPEPGGGVELVGVTTVVDRIRAVHAAQRTAIRQLGDQRVRTRRVGHGASCTRPRSAMTPRKARTSRSTSATSRAYFAASCST